MSRTGLLLSGALAGALALSGVALRAASPDGKAGEPKSGVEKGGMLSAFHPTHVTGADKGTSTCPVCNYPSNPAVQVWINGDSDKNVSAIVTALEKATRADAAEKLKAFVIYVNPERKSSGEITSRLKTLADQAKVQNVALTYLPGPDSEAVKEYEINTDPDVKNTVFVYKARKVDTKFVNLVADKSGLDALNTAIKSVVH